MKPRRVYDGVSEETARAAAALFDCELTQEPYRANGEPVWALNHRSESGNLRIVLLAVAEPSGCRLRPPHVGRARHH